LLESGHVVNASDICLFEKSPRFGGRTFSHHVIPDVAEGDTYVTELGAYRFSPDMHLPGDLILNKLKLETECWDPGCPDAAEALDMPAFNYHAPLQKLVDVYTENRGYGSAIEAMIMQLQENGARIFLGHKLVGLQKGGRRDGGEGNFTLTIETGGDRRAVSSTKLFLNLPRVSLRDVKGARELMGETVFSAFNCTRMDLPESFAKKNIVPQEALVKSYAYYEDAWWISKLGITDGSFPKEEFIPIVTKNGVPISLHYNDGPVKCKTGEDEEGKPIWTGRFVPYAECKGFLQTFYSFTNVSWYDRFQKDPREPLVEVRKEHGGVEAEALSQLHDAMMETHSELFRKRNISTDSIPPPSVMVISVWRRDHIGSTAPTKVYYRKGMLASACGVEGLTEKSYAQMLLTPFGTDAGVFLANNDYRATEAEQMYGDWAEESLLMSERALATMGVEKPGWLNATYYQEEVVKQMM